MLSVMNKVQIGLCDRDKNRRRRETQITNKEKDTHIFFLNS